MRLNCPVSTPISSRLCTGVLTSSSPASTRRMESTRRRICPVICPLTAMEMISPKSTPSSAATTPLRRMEACSASTLFIGRKPTAVKPCFLRRQTA